MEPRNRWIIAGAAAVVLAFAFIYFKGKTTSAASTTPTVVVSGTPPTDLSTVGNIPETGFNMGNYTGSGFNGLGAAGSPLAGTVGSNTPSIQAQVQASIAQLPPNLTPAQYQAALNLIAAHYGVTIEGGPGMAFQPTPGGVNPGGVLIPGPTGQTFPAPTSHPFITTLPITTGQGPGGQGRVTL